MRAILLTVYGLFVGIFMSYSQSLTLSIPQSQVFADEIIALDILTLDFDSIASVQYSLSWDPTIIQYENSETLDLDLVAVGDSDAETGSINVSWFDIDGQGKSLTDGQVFLRLSFTAIGEVGDISPVTINGDSLQIQAFKATDVPFEFIEIELIPENGSVEIIEENPQSGFSITNQMIQAVDCFGDFTGSITLMTNQDNVTYFWTGPNGFSSTDLNLEDLEAGEYALEVFAEDGSLIFSEVYLVDGPMSELMLSEILLLESECVEATGSAEIVAVGGTPPYILSLDNGAQFSNGFINNLAPGFYDLLVTDANGCSTEAQFEIEQADNLSFTLGGDIEACEGQTVNLSAGNYDQYLWSTGAASQVIDISTAGEYTVTVTSTNGCSATDTILISYIDEVDLQSPQTDIFICQGDSVSLSVSGGVDYEWIDPTDELTDTQGSNIVVRPNENTIYTVISESECGTDELEISVSIHQTTATAGEDLCVPVGETVMLNASGGEFYYWSGSDSEAPLNIYNIANPTASPIDSVQYFVMIIDQNNCTTFDTLSVFVADSPVDFIPHINMITPNGDGQNDVLDFGSISKFGPNNIRIFNRWGKIVYEKLNYQIDDERFSGEYNGEALPAGNYYYVLSFRDNQQIKQTLSIARED